MKSKSFALLLATSVLTTQTGCIVAVATNPAMLPASLGVFWLASEQSCARSDEVSCPGANILGWLGIALDAENPGRSETLNWIPVDEVTARKLSTHIAGLEAYNEELGQVIRANEAIERDLGPVASGKPTEADLNNLARTVGMTDSAELKRVLSGERLSREDLERFADVHSISTETARIYLSLRFKIKT